jgi:anti-anti-sigma regulatory factor
MTLGKNIKIDKLIPDLKKKSDTKIKDSDPSSIALSPHVELEKKEALKLVEEYQGIKIIIEPSRRKKVKKAIFFIEGVIDIQQAQFLTNKIKEAIVHFNLIEVKLRNVEDLDLSAIQIFYYFTTIYNQGEKTISFYMENLPIDLKTLLVKTKYNKLLFKKPLTATK